MKMDKSTLGIALLFAVTAIVGFVFGEHSSTTVAVDGVDGIKPTAAFIGTAIGAGVSAIGGLVSGIVQANKAKQAQRELDISQGHLDNWYESVMNQNILDRADSQSMLAEYRDAISEQNRKYADNAIKGGATEEGRVAMQNAANKGYANAISKIAAQGQAYKDSAAAQYMQGKMAYHNSIADLYAQAGKQVGNNISNAFGSISKALSGVHLPKEE